MGMLCARNYDWNSAMLYVPDKLTVFDVQAIDLLQCGTPDARSSLTYTRSLRAQLPILLNDLNITSFLDVGCGNFGWLSTVVFPTNCAYIGVDIVAKYVRDLTKATVTQHYAENATPTQALFARRTPTTALCFDATSTDLPKCDLVLCRDVMDYWSYANIEGFLGKLIASGSKYLAATTYNEPSFANMDTPTGMERKLNLFRKPFCFPAAYVDNIYDYTDDHPRSVTIWRVDTLRAKLYTT